MKIFKCDGHKFTGNVKCENQTEYEDEKGYPENWLTITGNITNNLRDHHCITANGVRHFCSINCLTLFLQKDIE